MRLCRPRAQRSALLAAACAALLAAPLAAAGLTGNPANHPRLINKPLEGYNYDGAERCVSRVPDGTQALRRWLERNIRGSYWGAIRCSRLGGGNWSVHAEGRAIDWHLNAGDRSQRRAGMRFIDTLLARDRRGNHAALARRMGIQGLIFACHDWWSGPGGLGKYSPCYRANGERRPNLDPTQAHRDHIHIELNRPGAGKRTSFWRSRLAGQ